MLAITFERETAAGAPWCLPRDAAAVRRWVVDQGRELGGAIRRLVRFAFVLAHATEAGAADFLYLRIKTLRAGEFRAALEACGNNKRPSKLRFELTDKGPVLRTAGGSFEIDYRQMPRLGALLDILHNALGYGAVADILAPMLVSSDDAPFESVARQLEREFASWLKVRLETRHHLRQAQVIRAFLAARRSLSPDAVNDETIFEFWQLSATSREPDAVDGFRLFVNAARAMLGYRQALADAMLEARLAAPDQLLASYPADTEACTQEGDESWVSPLAQLLGYAGEVKWLTGKEIRALAHYLGGPFSGTDKLEAENGKGHSRWTPGLAGYQPFDLRFCRTLLRADVFGAAQASIIARRQKKHADALTPVMATLHHDAYETAAAVYAEVGEQLRFEALAALHLLAVAGKAEAILLVSALGGAEAIEAIRAHVAPGSTNRAAEDALIGAMAQVASQAALHPERLEADAGRALFDEARKCLRKVRRAGFSAPHSPESVSSLMAAAFVLPDLLAEIQRLRKALAKSQWLGDALGDKTAFEQVFADIYPQDEGTPAAVDEEVRG